MLNERDTNVRKALSLVMAFILAFGSASLAPPPAKGFSASLTGSEFAWSAIGDGKLYIYVEPNTPIIVSRAIAGANVWKQALWLNFYQTGTKSAANIVINWTDLPFTCLEYAAITQFFTSGTYSQIKIDINDDCQNWLYWGNTFPIHNGYFDATTLIAHEVGHTLGSAHYPANDGVSSLMDPSIPSGKRIAILSSRDAAVRFVYPATLIKSYSPPVQATWTD